MRPKNVIACVVASTGFACSGAAVRLAAPQPTVGHGVEHTRARVDSTLIPRELLFGNPDRSDVQISPDGKTLSFLGPAEGVLNLWVAPADDPKAARQLTQDKGRGVQTYFWAYDSQRLLYLQDDKGDENWRVHCVELQSGRDRDLTPVSGVQARIEAVSQKRPAEVVVGLNDRMPEFHDLYRLNIRTGERSLLLRNDEFASFVVDDDYAVKLAVRQTADGGKEVLAPAVPLTGESSTASAKPSWRHFMQVPQADALTTAPLSYTADHKALYITDSRQRDTSALFSLDVSSGKATLLAQDTRADIADVLIDPIAQHVEAVAFNYERKRWHIVEPAIAADLEYLQSVTEGDLNVAARSLDDKTWIVEYHLDRGPVRFYRYDRQPRQATFLFTGNSQLEGMPLAAMQPVVIRARDGLDLVSYLTLPKGRVRDADGQANLPAPLVLSVHGGPWARDEWCYDEIHQWLANRGYAVLSVNFRGSTGFGKRFTNAGDKQWGAKMHDDLLDAVDWAIQHNIAPRDKIAIMGGSYGGYATLVGLAFTPKVFACGVDIVGPSNLRTLLASFPSYWKPVLYKWTSRVGDPGTEQGRELLDSRSPLQRADQIERPLLIGQGKNDPRVKQAESDQLVNALKHTGIPVTYVVYGDEGHGFARPENRLSFYGVAEAFLAECLGGVYEPIGDDFEGSSITIPYGRDYIPGLPRLAAQPADPPPAR